MVLEVQIIKEIDGSISKIIENNIVSKSSNLNH